MSNPLLIFCEGVTDQVFIADCLEIFYSVKVDRQIKKNYKINMTFEGGKIEDIEGCEKLKLQIYLEMLKDNSEKGGVNLIIFDADEKDRGNNSFDNAIESLKGIQKHHNVNFDFYLWPNHAGDGVVENLIRQLINSDREPVMSCIENHQKCLSETGCADLRKANEKDLIKYYLYINYIDKTEGRNVDYKNTMLWNLNPNDIPDLQKFKNFMDQYFLHNGTI